jgi:hypothetical protein
MRIAFLQVLPGCNWLKIIDGKGWVKKKEQDYFLKVYTETRRNVKLDSIPHSYDLINA